MIYLDYAASAPIRPAAFDALATAMHAVGNAASPHAPGRQSEARLALARREVAAMVGCLPAEVYFCSGGTEADNWALRGVLAGSTRRHVVISAVEHKAIALPARALAAEGAITLSEVRVDARGLVTPDALREALQPDTALVSIMAVNNEMGAVQPLAELAPWVRAAGAVLHVDAVQAFHLPLASLPFDLLSLSAHKLGGAPGVGALVIRRGVRVAPLLLGGRHERGLRPGTPNAPGIAAFGAAVQAVRAGGAIESERLAGLRDALWRGIHERVPAARRLGEPAHCAPHVLALVIPGLDGEALVTQLDLAGLAASSGAACSALEAEPSSVLLALGLAVAEVAGSLRLSLGWATTPAEIADAIRIVGDVAGRLHGTPPLAL